MKKLTALLLALVMVLAIGATAFADPTTSNGAKTDVYSGSENANAVISGTTIPLTKSIVLFNTNGSEIREPNIKFTYTVTPVDETAANQGKPLTGVTITDDGSRNDDTPVTVNIYDGVADAFTTPLEITFSENNAKVAAAQAGTELERTDNLVINTGAFDHAGVYRFKITETVQPGDITTVGLDTRDDTAYDPVRFLDVYIKNGTSGLEMYGAVIFKSTTSEATDPIKGDITPDTEKTTGFGPNNKDGSGSYDYENDKTVDKYHTFNLEVNKTITGGLADLSHDFPFEITLTGNKDAVIKTDYSKTGATYVGTEPTEVPISTTAVVLTPALSNGDSVTITGIPVGTTVLVKETNDTDDEYTPSITTYTGFTELNLTESGKLTPKTGTTQLEAATEITSKDAKSVIGLTNTLAEVSPTGVALRFAPYAIMLGAGVALFIILKVRKNKAAEA